MLDEISIRDEYNDLLDKYGHSLNLNYYRKRELIIKIELLEWILQIKASDLKVVR